MKNKVAASRVNLKRNPDRPRYKPRVQREWGAEYGTPLKKTAPQNQLDAGPIALAAKAGWKKPILGAGMTALVLLAAGTGVYRWNAVSGDVTPDRLAGTLEPAPVAIAAPEPTLVQNAPSALAEVELDALPSIAVGQSPASVPESISTAFVPPTSTSKLQAPAPVDVAFACVDCQPQGRPVQATTLVVQAASDIDQSPAFVPPRILAAFVPSTISPLQAPALAEATFTCVDCRPLSQPVQAITSAVPGTDQKESPQSVVSVVNDLPKGSQNSSTGSKTIRVEPTPQAGRVANNKADILAAYRKRICKSLGNC